MLDANDRSEIERKCEEMRPRILEELRSQTEAALRDSERKIVDDIQTVVSNAVETKYKVVIGSVGTNTERKEDSRNFEIVKVVLPVLLTIGLGYWIFVLEKSVERKVDDQKQDLAARLTLTQQYQKRKVEIYEKCANDMSNLLQGLELLRIDPNQQKPASDSIHALYEDARNNALYVSEDIADQLNTVRSDAISDLQLARTGTLKFGTVEKDIAEAERRMKKELSDVRAPLTTTP
jgi:flagellar basal body-associated protein FliL